ncbi:uncharacterized protein LOC118468381 [Anopheles albimanus]|uniref:uncharacterized protein LOC118468381 n=1 Tax=Anopheles albimanus TaxID=7167 RepID=UPI00163E8EE3|nr:uncharacterized protein LOC118468381 [Anopheles albimanus]
MNILSVCLFSVYVFPFAMAWCLEQIFQPWVIRTYGDRAKTKTITLKKQARIIKTLRGQEMNNPDSSKFRFWVKTKGFTTSRPGNFQDVFTYQNIPENDGCILYAPSGGLEPGQPYKKVAVVENFFDIIYGIHVSLGSRASRHAGQKRTYRTITETYAFLPREAVTKFLSLCGQCSKLTTKPSSATEEDRSSSLRSQQALPEERLRDATVRFDKASCESTLDAVSRRSTAQSGTRSSEREYSPSPYYELLRNFYESARSSVCKREVPIGGVGGRRLARSTLELRSHSEPVVVEQIGAQTARPNSATAEVETRRCVSEVQRQVIENRTVHGAKPLVGLNNNFSDKRSEVAGGPAQAKPITSTYLGVTRSFGLEDDDALNMVSLFYYFYGYFSMQKLCSGQRL